MTDPRRRPWQRDGGRLVAVAALMLLLGCGGASQPTDDRDEADSTRRPPTPSVRNRPSTTTA